MHTGMHWRNIREWVNVLKSADLDLRLARSDYEYSYFGAWKMWLLMIFLVLSTCFLMLGARSAIFCRSSLTTSMLVWHFCRTFATSERTYSICGAGLLHLKAELAISWNILFWVSVAKCSRFLLWRNFSIFSASFDLSFCRGFIGVSFTIDPICCYSWYMALLGSK